MLLPPQEAPAMAARDIALLGFWRERQQNAIPLELA